MQHLICAVDVETTGLDPNEDFITEIGAALLDPHSWEVLDTFSTFVFEPEALPLKPEIVKLTGITDEMVMTGLDLATALEKFKKFSQKATVFMAHNAAFDKGFIEIAASAAGVKLEDENYSRPWYCSKGDVPTHQGKTCTKLSHLALDYGLTVDGSTLHRALDDVKLMGRVLKATGLQFSEIKVWADEPWIYLAMSNKTFSKENNEKAKKDGYGWEKCVGTYQPLFPKRWTKRVKASKLEEEKAKDVGFTREVIQPVG